MVIVTGLSFCLCRYRDKESGSLKGDGTVSYEDPFSAASAVQWFNNKDWKGDAWRVQEACVQMQFLHSISDNDVCAALAQARC